MGLFQKAVETYDTMSYRAGKVFAEEKEPLAPMFHITARAGIEIVLDQAGTFIEAHLVDSKAPKIIIPVTEKSMGRTSKAAAKCPHPLCDHLGYLLPCNQTEYSCFLKQLSDWANSEFTTPKLQAILRYVQTGTILDDLSGAGIIQLNEAGRPKNEKLMVCWSVNGLGEGASGPCWEDLELMKAFSGYTASKLPGASPVLCMLSGEIASPAGMYPKGIVPAHGNAKLISSNDTRGFTYRGRFLKDWQVATVSDTASQKAHCALRWLVANQGVAFGPRTFLCWSPRGCPVPEIDHPMMRGTSWRAADPTQYRQQLSQVLSGWKKDLPEHEGVVITAFDAATDGRLAVAYYNELPASDFLQRLYSWDETCCWEKEPCGVQSPSLRQILINAFGTLQEGKLKSDDRILAKQMQRLIACRVDKAFFPLDIEQALVEKASNLQIYKSKTEKETARLRGNLLFVTCAVIRKYHIDHLKEELSMSLDTENRDRSYLFGRLLAIAEAVENSTYTDDDRRETNAMRMQKIFALRPLSIWRMLEEKLVPYYRRLSPGQQGYYRKITQEIVDKLPSSDKNLNQKLDDIYLIGYYHQRAHCRKKPDDQTDNNEEE